MDQIGDTAFKFCFNLRQRLIEKVLENKLEREFGKKVAVGCQLEHLVDESVSSTRQKGEECPIAVKIREGKSGSVRSVRA